ncbi:Uncharacterised protein [Yersinia pseudotuberculosis]|nr:Uncharacterised protein [Yersinia pseudotuberculosis]
MSEVISKQSTNTLSKIVAFGALSNSPVGAVNIFEQFPNAILNDVTNVLLSNKPAGISLRDVQNLNAN